ncbi:Uncharacterised protein [Bordetella pertussis]|nr:Uncharacterised protein [Bordetella pertussis]CFM36923.1 Uncharacterised protein [Bordetella pertussis]CFM65391.1 Uncharacterised protein [Bordetella pertussis]CFM89997.1 Uncharacterised protein [Bordetella pertussis]CFN41459.1 Uncharacterised protein [Bordetella pertussis]
MRPRGFDALGLAGGQLVGGVGQARERPRDVPRKPGGQQQHQPDPADPECDQWGGDGRIQAFERDDQPFAQRRRVVGRGAGRQRDEDFRPGAARQRHTGAVAETLVEFADQAAQVAPDVVGRRMAAFVLAPHPLALGLVFLGAAMPALQPRVGRQRARPEPPLVAGSLAHELRAFVGRHLRQRGAQGADGGGDVVDRHVFHEFVPEIGHRGQRGGLRQQDRTQHQQDQAHAQRARRRQAEQFHQGENR